MWGGQSGVCDIWNRRRRRRAAAAAGGTSTSYLSAYQALEPKTALLQVLVQVQVQVLVFCCSYTFASQPSERPLRAL